MDKTLIIRSLDIEIEKLQRARALLSSTGAGSSGAGRGRRRAGPRHTTAAARKRISDAQKKRWAKVKSGQKKK